MVDTPAPSWVGERLTLEREIERNRSTYFGRSLSHEERPAKLARWKPMLTSMTGIAMPKVVNNVIFDPGFHPGFGGGPAFFPIVC